MEIEVKQTGRTEPQVFAVRIDDQNGETRHLVTLSQADFQRIAAGSCSAEELIEAAFRFLLDREPKEAILSQFDLMTIARYFPEFEARLSGYLTRR